MSFSSSSSFNQENNSADDKTVYTATLSITAGKDPSKNVSIVKYQLDRNGMLYNVEWKTFENDSMSGPNQNNDATELTKQSISVVGVQEEEEPRTKCPRIDMTTSHFGVPTVPEHKAMMDQQSFLNAFQLISINPCFFIPTTSEISSSVPEQSPLVEQKLSPTSFKQCSEESMAIPNNGDEKNEDEEEEEIDVVGVDNYVIPSISEESSSAPTQSNSLFKPKKLSTIPFEQILEENMETLKCDEEDKDTEEEVVGERAPSAGCSNSQVISNKHKFVTEEDLKHLYEHMEHTPFELEDGINRKLKCRTFMKMKDSHWFIRTVDLERCLDIALQETLSKCDGDKKKTIMNICIHHPQLIDGYHFIENVTYATCNGADLIVLFQIYRKYNSYFAVDSQFRIQIDIIDEPKEKTVMGEHSLLKAIGIAQAFQNKFDSDDEEDRNIFEIMKTPLAQEKVASFLRKVLQLDEKEADVDFNTIVKYFSKTKMYVFSEKRMDVYNKDASEFIFLDEDDGVFDFYVLNKFK